MNTQILWILTILIFLIVEICTVSLVSIWFCVGAAFAEIASLCHLNLIIQLILFLTISFLAMLFIMPAVRKKNKKNTEENKCRLLDRTDWNCNGRNQWDEKYRTCNDQWK